MHQRSDPLGETISFAIILNHFINLFAKLLIPSDTQLKTVKMCEWHVVNMNV